MEQKRPIPTERLRTIRGQMVERFSLDELRDLTFVLGADWDQLPGNNKSAKTTELLELLNRRTQLPTLLAQLQTLRPDDAWALDDLDESAESPYKGLESYNEADAGLFFGREPLIGTLLGALRGQSFMAVVGASGSGKSSVIRAGVVPVLKGNRPPPDGVAPLKGSAGWAYLEMNPTDRPLEQLALTLTRDLDTVGETRTVIRDVAEDPAVLHLYLRKYLERQKKPRAFLLVDQFEELFTLCKGEPERAAFIDGLLAAAGGGATTIVLTLRADFYHHCLRYPGLRDALQQRQQLIGAMDEAELREAVEQPALRTGYELEPGLADKIVRDAGDEAGALPLLSHALLETWKRREGRRLTHAGYNEAGGVGGAIARTAEQAYNDLDPAQQAVARRILLQLTELGEGAEDTRRVVGLDNLLAGDAAARSEAETVLNALSQARLVTTDGKGAQVTHEALIREWPALREWLRDNREALRLERRLEAAATEWSEGGRDPSYLYEGAQLATACQWAENNPANVSDTVRAFLDAATAEEQREAAEREAARRQRERLVRRAFVGVSVFAALAVLAAVFAFLQRDTAIESEATAVAAQSTTAYEATRAEFNLNQAVAARATSDFNETLAEIERDNAVAALNDSSARLLLNLSQSVFEDDPLLADRLLLEAMAVGSENAVDEAADALSANLLSGLTTTPITATTVLYFTDVHTGTVYVVDYQLENDLLISGKTGVLVVPLNGRVYNVTPLPDSPFFVVRYYGGTSELRRTDDIEQAILLKGGVTDVTPLPDSPFFVVDYSDGTSELRRTDDIEQAIPLNGDVYYVTPLPDSLVFAIHYTRGAIELRRTDDIERAIPLNGDVTYVTPLPDSPFFAIHYSNMTGELRRTDDIEQAIPLNGRVSYVTPLPDSPFFVVGYSDGKSELRRTDGIERTIPLNGGVSYVTLLPDSPFFAIHYSDGTSELRRTDGIEQTIPLKRYVSDVTPLPDSPFFVVGYSGVTGELRRTDDIEQAIPLKGDVINVIPLPDSPFFVVDYYDMTSELRRTDDIERAIPLNGDVTDVTPLPDSPFFAISYSDMTGELRRTDDIEQAIPLNGDVSDVIPLSDSPFFFVDYYDGPDELRRKDSGEAVTDEGGRRTATSAAVLRAGEDGYYFMRYQDGSGVIATADRTLFDLGRDAEQAIYFPETNHIAVRYGDGRMVYIDMNLIEAIGGPDGQATLAAMSPDELVAFACDLLFTGNPEWNEAKLDEYLAFLPEGRERACDR